MTTRRFDLVWLALLLATGVSWALAEARPGAAVTAVVLSLALFKGSRVALDFMGLRGVRLFWRSLVLGWLALVLAVIALSFLLAPAP